MKIDHQMATIGTAVIVVFNLSQLDYCVCWSDDQTTPLFLSKVMQLGCRITVKGSNLTGREALTELRFKLEGFNPGLRCICIWEFVTFASRRVVCMC